MIRREAAPAASAGAAPASTFDMYALIGLSASTLAHSGDTGVARPRAAPAAIAATPGSSATASLRVVLLGT